MNKVFYPVALITIIGAYHYGFHLFGAEKMERRDAELKKAEAERLSRLKNI